MIPGGSPVTYSWPSVSGVQTARGTTMTEPDEFGRVVVLWDRPDLYHIVFASSLRLA